MWHDGRERSLCEPRHDGEHQESTNDGATGEDRPRGQHAAREKRVHTGTNDGGKRGRPVSVVLRVSTGYAFTVS